MGVKQGVCRTADVLASYALLSRLNPVTHSVGNCVKRVVVIGVSIIVFKTPASMLNIIGTLHLTSAPSLGIKRPVDWSPS